MGWMWAVFLALGWFLAYFYRMGIQVIKYYIGRANFNLAEVIARITFGDCNKTKLLSFLLLVLDYEVPV